MGKTKFKFKLISVDDYSEVFLEEVEGSYPETILETLPGLVENIKDEMMGKVRISVYKLTKVSVDDYKEDMVFVTTIIHSKENICELLSLLGQR